MPPEPAIPGGYLREPVPDFVKQFFSKDFISSWKEWASQRYPQIIESTTTKGTVTLFTVPEGQTLFITTAFVAQEGSDSSAGSIRAGGKDIVGITRAGGSDEPGHEASIVFSMPLKLRTGELVESVTSGGINAGATVSGFTGFLVDATLS